MWLATWKINLKKKEKYEDIVWASGAGIPEARLTSRFFPNNPTSLSPTPPPSLFHSLHPSFLSFFFDLLSGFLLFSVKSVLFLMGMVEIHLRATEKREAKSELCLGWSGGLSLWEFIVYNHLQANTNYFLSSEIS